MRAKITIWARYYYKERKIEHNHIENGWSKLPHPKPMCEAQRKSWAKADGWGMQFGYLLNGKVILDQREGEGV